jgi:cobalt/nickel transport system permease protein
MEQMFGGMMMMGGMAIPFETLTPQLHIPDGFLSIAISIVCWIIAIGLLAVAVRRTQAELGERQVPLMGIMAAFIFAAQMINFPVAGGTSGHMLGGALAAIALGPWAGMLVMACVIGVQALLFQDGGLLVLGANILNMGMITALIGFGLYRSVIRQSLAVRLAAAGVAAWISVIAAAFATSIQLGLSGTSPFGIVLPAMLGVHLFIGIGEALITVAALSFIARTRPEIVDPQLAAERGGGAWAVVGMVVAAAVVLLSPFASADPDGLERVAEDSGFLDRGLPNTLGPLPDYSVPFLGETPLSTIVAGLVGVIIVAGLAIPGGGYYNYFYAARESGVSNSAG